MDEVVNRDPSDNPGGDMAIVENLDVLVGEIQPTATNAKAGWNIANILTDAIAHEFGHDLGNIHLRDAANNYIDGNGDVMGTGAAGHGTGLHTFITFAPLVEMAVGVPITSDQFTDIFNYYAMYDKYETYTHNDAAPAGGYPAAAPADDLVGLGVTQNATGPVVSNPPPDTPSDDVLGSGVLDAFSAQPIVGEASRRPRSRRRISDPLSSAVRPVRPLFISLTPAMQR